MSFSGIQTLQKNCTTPMTSLVPAEPMHMNWRVSLPMYFLIVFVLPIMLVIIGPGPPDPAPVLSAVLIAPNDRTFCSGVKKSAPLDVDIVDNVSPSLIMTIAQNRLLALVVFPPNDKDQRIPVNVHGKVLVNKTVACWAVVTLCLMAINFLSRLRREAAKTRRLDIGWRISTVGAREKTDRPPRTFLRLVGGEVRIDI